MRILIIAGISRSLVNFRGPLIKAMLEAGHEVAASRSLFPSSIFQYYYVYIPLFSLTYSVFIAIIQHD